MHRPSGIWLLEPGRFGQCPSSPGMWGRGAKLAIPFSPLNTCPSRQPKRFCRIFQSNSGVTGDFPVYRDDVICPRIDSTRLEMREGRTNAGRSDEPTAYPQEGRVSILAGRMSWWRGPATFGLGTDAPADRDVKGGTAKLFPSILPSGHIPGRSAMMNVSRADAPEMTIPPACSPGSRIEGRQKKTFFSPYCYR
jgi:hypothetical protein